MQRHKHGTHTIQSFNAENCPFGKASRRTETTMGVAGATPGSSITTKTRCHVGLSLRAAFCACRFSLAAPFAFSDDAFDVTALLIASAPSSSLLEFSSSAWPS